MEITMQWLDELEDLLFAFALAWHRLCRLALTLGFAASLLVLAPGHTRPLLLALTAIALLSVLAWSIAVTATLLGTRRSPRLAA